MLFIVRTGDSTSVVGVVEMRLYINAIFWGLLYMRVNLSGIGDIEQCSRIVVFG